MYAKFGIDYQKINDMHAISKRKILPDVVWVLKDVIVVTLGVFGGGALFILVTLSLLGDSRTTFRLAQYVAGLLTIFFPLYWVKRRYGLSKEAFGLEKGAWRLSSLVTIGVAVGLAYIILAKVSPFGHSAPMLPDAKPPDHYLIYLLLLPISIDGFAILVLTPIGEEIFDRGFIYGYLRKKLGFIIGIVVQALLFSLFHFSYIHGDALYLIGYRFLIGLILGTLYETTGSLYPSIICHSVVNYGFMISRYL